LPEGTVPALVSTRLQADASAVLVQNKHRQARHVDQPETHLLRGGFAVCGYCGSRLHAASPAIRDSGKGRYICSGWKDGRCTHGGNIQAPILDGAVWTKVEAILTDPSVISDEIERRRQADPTADDLRAVDGQLSEVSRQQANYVTNLGLVTGAAAELIAGKLAELEGQYDRLMAEREAILQRHQTWKAAQARLTSLERWCRIFGANLGQLTYEERREALEALGIKAKVYRADHTPRIVIEANILLDEAGAEGEVLSAAGTARGSPDDDAAYGCADSDARSPRR
jgi:hypothetical protein